jgi:peptidoglycan hydrolase-like protein with peptidoglycan-binding domain
MAVINIHASGGGQQSTTDATSATAPVVTTDVSQRQQVSGTLGHSGTFRVIAPGSGTLTWLPSPGTLVTRGKPAYEVDGKPVILMFGDRPPWRAFQSGMSDDRDVLQLESNLKALGYGAGLTVDQHFSSDTSTAICQWQQAAGLPVTGTVPLGQVVFVSQDVRIDVSDLNVGASVEPGATVEHGTSAQPAITLQLTTSVLASTHVGDSVVVRLPDGSTKSGTITTIGAVVINPTSSSGTGQTGSGSNSAPTAPVVITVTGDVTGVLPDAQVQVWVTVEQHRHVFAVPIPALRALPGRRYELVVSNGGQTRHVPIQTGLFDEVTGLVEVSDDGLAAGQRVEVPRSWPVS